MAAAAARRVAHVARAHPLATGAVAALLAALMLNAVDPAALAAQPPRVRETDLEAIFRSRQQEWVSNAQDALLGLFGGLLMLEISYSSIKWHRDRLGVDQILISVLWKVGAVALMMLFFRFPHLTTERVIDAFAHLGGMVAGNRGMALTPTEIVTQGGEIVQRLVDQLGVEQGMPLEPPEDQGLLTRFSNWMNQAYNALGIGLVNALFSMFFSAVVVLLVALVVLVAYMIIALQLLLVKLEAILVLSTGIVFVPFGSFRLTAGLAEGYFKYALEVGVRFFFPAGDRGGGIRPVRDALRNRERTVEVRRVARPDALGAEPAVPGLAGGRGPGVRCRGLRVPRLEDPGLGRAQVLF
ncbi:type IV secretion system protein [Longimicrobium sp.]|uniref:type IV secretion system protein n=1 Tax=Longimicrobium sp. TaxID=2029185 RepID=UPI002E30A70A|nr:type IV secretion system protein [Longimicrobium sp.]